MTDHELPGDPDAPVAAGGSLVLVAVAAGGSLGSAARYGVSEVVPVAAGFPWPTLLANASGSLLLGVLMVVVTDVLTGRPWLRPFLGVGVLGGYTTFSAYALETRDLLAAGHPALAGAYAGGSVVAGLLAVWIGLVATRRALGDARR